MKIIFMGTPHFAVPTLEKLLASKHEIIAIYTQNPKKAGRNMQLYKQPVYEIAEKYNLPIFTPKTLKSEESQQEFINLKADVAVVAAYGLILPKPILEGTKYGCLNIHPSTLPRWRGAMPLQHTILNGDKQTSVCIMKMDEGLDTGDILLQENIDLEDNVNIKYLHDYTANLGAELLLKTLEGLENNNFKPIKQGEEGATYARKLTKEDGQINWQENYKTIDRKLRALSIWPGVYFNFKNERILIYEADCLKQEHKYDFGEIIDENFTIACEGGIVKPQILQREGKNKMPIHEFIKGFRFNVGDKIN